MITAEEYSESYEKTKTRKRVEAQMKKYLEYVLPNKTQEDKSKTYLKEAQKGTRNVKDDLKNYVEYLQEQMVGSSIVNYLNTVLYWMDINEIKFSKWELKTIKRMLPENRTVTEEEEIDKETLKVMIEALKKPQHKLMFLIMESAGTRITETGEIRIENIHREETPMRITLTGTSTKNKKTRNVMVTKECADKILEYIGNKTEGRLFKITEAKNLMANWRKIMQGAGNYCFINGKKRCTFHPHMLRKWFLSQFALYSSKEIGEELAGHEGYLSRSYRRYSVKECAEYYLKAEKALTLYSENLKTNNTETAYYEA